MDFTNDELVCILNALNNYWSENEEDMIEDLIEQFGDQLREQRM